MRSGKLEKKENLGIIGFSILGEKPLYGINVL